VARLGDPQARADRPALASEDRPPAVACRAERSSQDRRDEISRIRDLTATIDALHRDLARLVAQVAPQLLAEHGLGVLIAAKLIGETAGISRFTSDAKLARLAGCAPIPVSSGHTDRYRLVT
jgi:transposase